MHGLDSFHTFHSSGARQGGPDDYSGGTAEYAPSIRRDDDQEGIPIPPPYTPVINKLKSRPTDPADLLATLGGSGRMFLARRERMASAQSATVGDLPAPFPKGEQYEGIH